MLDTIETLLQVRGSSVNEMKSVVSAQSIE